MVDTTVVPYSSDVRGYLFLRMLIRLSPVSNSVRYPGQRCHSAAGSPPLGCATVPLQVSGPPTFLYRTYPTCYTLYASSARTLRSRARTRKSRACLHRMQDTGTLLPPARNSLWPLASFCCEKGFLPQRS